MIKSIETQLSELGLRLATQNERGWYVIVLNDDGTVKRVWATDGRHTVTGE